jgi:hypothetical protein
MSTRQEILAAIRNAEAANDTGAAKVLAGLLYRQIQSEQSAAPVQPPVPPEPEDQSVFRSIADVPLSAAKGVTTGVGSIADAMGANNQVSQAIYGAGSYLDSLLSAGAKQDQQEVARIMQEAQDKGVLEQVKAGLNALTVAPVDLVSNVLGTAAPVVIATLYAGAAAIPVGIGLGLTTGVGIVKNTIYNSVLEEAKKVGVSEDQAIKAADAAQSYTGDNAGLIAGGGLLGAIASATGLEATALRAIQAGVVKKVGKELAEATVKPVVDKAAKGVIRRGLEGFGKESSTEALQAGQEQYAGNIAAQRAGFNVPTMRGVAGAAALEGLAGGVVGGGADVFLNSSPAPDEAKNALDKFTEEAGYDLGSDEAGTFANLKLDAEMLGIPIDPEDNIDTLEQKIQAKEFENTVAGEKLRVRAEANGIPINKNDTEEVIVAKLAATSTKDTTPVRLIPEKLREAARVSGINIGKNDTLEDVVNNLAASSVLKPVRADIPTPAATTTPVVSVDQPVTSDKLEEGELFTQNTDDVNFEAAKEALIAEEADREKANLLGGGEEEGELATQDSESNLADSGIPNQTEEPREFIKYDSNDPFREYADETQDESRTRELREAAAEQQAATEPTATPPTDTTTPAVTQETPGIQDLSKEDEDARVLERGARAAKTKQLFDDLGIPARATIRQKFMYSRIDLDPDLEKALTRLLSNSRTTEDTKTKVGALLTQRFFTDPNTMKSPISDAPPLSGDGVKLVEDGNLGGVIGHLINNTKNPVVRRALIAIPGLNLKTKLVVGPSTDSEFGGEYDAANDTITVDPTQINEPVLVHEIIHAGISHVLSNPNHPLTKELTRLFKLVKSKLGDRYGTKNVDEFASELIANEEFQQEIKALENGNIFTRIMRAITQFLLGIPPKASIFDQAVDTVTDIISISDQILRKDNEWDGRRGQLNPNAPGVNKKIAKIADITATADEIVDESGALYTATQALLKNDYSKLSSMFGTMMNKAQRAAFIHALTTRGLFGVAEKLKISALAAVENLLLRKLPGLRNDMRKLDDRFIDLILKWGAKNGKNLVRLGIATNAARIFQINPRGVDLTTAIENDATVAYYDSRIKDPSYRNNKSHNQKRKAARIKEINYVYQAYEALGVEGQNIFTRMNETYKKQLTDYEATIRENVSAILENIKVNKKQTEEQALKEKEDLEAALSPIFRALFSEVHKVGVYFPLGRHGNFWVRVGKGKNGETQFFDSEVARDIYIKSVRLRYVSDPNKTPPITKGSHPDELQGELFSGDNKIGTTLLLKQLFDKIDVLPGTLSIDPSTGGIDINAAIVEDLKNSILDMYLRSLPGADLRKRYMHSTMKAGFSSDVLRTFINYSFRHSNQLPRLKYAQQIAFQLSAARDSTEGMPDDEAGRIQDLVLAIRDRAMPELNPQGSDTWLDFAAQFANQATFLYTMTSLRTALVALTQLPVFGTPKLVANYGLANTTQMIAKYTGSILAGNTFSMKDVHTDLNGNITHDWVMPNMAGASAFKNNPRLVDAYETALSWGTFVNGFGSEFQAAGERPTRKQFTLVTRGKKLAMTFMTGAFKTTERMSREIMFMSTYELAFDKAKKEKLDTTAAHTRAINEADKFTNQTMFDYSRANKQPILYKTPGARVFFQFATFPINVAGFMVRNAATLLSAVKEKDPAMAKVAAVEFFGTMGCVFMFAGVTGLPFYSLIMGVMEALRDQLFDPEEYDDKTDPRSNVPLPIWFTETYLPRIFGGGASVVQSGPISTLLDINIGSSVGLNNLFFKDEVLADGAKDWVQKYMLGVFSPPSISVVGQIASGVDLMNEGQFLRGAERIMPAQFRGLAVALRLGKEGSETPTGMRLLDPEFYTTGKLIAQGIGFKTVTEEQISKANFAAKGYENKLEIERNQFLKRLNNAYRAIEKADSKDVDSLWLKFDGIVDEMIKFSIVNPVSAFTSEGINTSLRSKVEAREKSKYTKGLSTSSDKKLDLLMQLLNREYEQE